MNRPRFAIEATNLTDDRATGVGRYTRQLVEALSALDVPAQDEFELMQLCKRSRWKFRERLAQGPRLSSQSWYGAIWPLPRPAVTLVHVPDEREPPWKVPVVATVHDLYAALRINYVDEARRQRKLRFYEHLRDRCLVLEIELDDLAAAHRHRLQILLGADAVKRNDLGAHVRQQHAGEGAGTDAGKFDNAEAGERTGGANLRLRG